MLANVKGVLIVAKQRDVVVITVVAMAVADVVASSVAASAGATPGRRGKVCIQ